MTEQDPPTPHPRPMSERLRPPGLSPVDVIVAGWELMKKHPILIAASLLVGVGQQALPQVVSNVIPALSDELSIVIGLQGLIALVNLPIAAFFEAGMIVFLLALARRQGPDIAQVIQGTPYFLRILGAQLLVACITLLILLVTALPGAIAWAATDEPAIGVSVLAVGVGIGAIGAAYIGLGVQLASFLIVDRGLGVVDALRESWSLTDGYKLQLFLIGLLYAVVLLAGFMACCVGIIVSMAVIRATQVGIYEQLAGITPATELEAFD